MSFYRTRRALFWLGCCLLALAAALSTPPGEAQASGLGSTSLLFQSTTSTPTRTATPTLTRTPTRTATPSCPVEYVVAQSTATMVAGSTLVSGSQCDDCIFDITLPFPYYYYDQYFTSLHASDNGLLDFTVGNPTWLNVCLPANVYTYSLMPHWFDITMDDREVQNCIGYCGAYTSISGTAPNRIFNLEYRAVTFDAPNNRVNFVVRFHESQRVVEYIYGLVDPTTVLSTTIGVQRDPLTFTMFHCPAEPDTITNGTKLTFTHTYACPSVTPTAIPTETNTPTFTQTATRTSTPIPTASASPTASTVTLRGHVILQGRPAPPSPRWSVPVSGTLVLLGGSLTFSFSTTTDQSGYFTVPTGLPPDVYSWRIKNPQTLANTGISTFLADVNNVEMGILMAGDANNDNCVTIVDFNITRISFGKSLGDPGYDPRADYNGDNSVSVTDFNMLRLNSGQCGALPLTTPTPAPTNTATRTPTFTPTRTPTSTPTPIVNVVGHIFLQGRPAQPHPRQSVPITLTLRLGTGGPDFDFSATTDQSGFFTVTAPAVGIFNYRVKYARGLANSGSVTISGGTVQVEMGSILLGDADNNNCIALVDFSLTRNSFGKSIGDPGYDPRADFNGDNAVNVSDFSLLRNNYGQCGAAPIGPAGQFGNSPRHNAGGGKSLPPMGLVPDLERYRKLYLKAL